MAPSAGPRLSDKPGLTRSDPLATATPAIVRTASNACNGVALAVNALIERAERSSREISQRQAYAAVCDFAATIWVVGDQHALEQLFLNLLINGVQATEAGGQVDVRVALGRDATVTIADTGCGIPEGALDRVFESFYSSTAE